jgi:hypothetical protein
MIIDVAIELAGQQTITDKVQMPIQRSASQLFADLLQEVQKLAIFCSGADDLILA